MQEKILWFDVETTGVDTNNDKICEISFITTDLACNIIDNFHWYINPEKESCKQAIEKHGLTTEFLSKYSIFKDKSKEIYNILKDYKYIGGYNILKFDVPIILEEFSRCEMVWNFKDHTYIDPYKMLLKYESRKLTNVYERFTGKNLEDAHTTDADVKATIEIFPKIINYFNIESLNDEFVTFDENQLDIDGYLIFDEDKNLILNFGKKHKGRKVSDILDIDKEYIYWIIEKADKISNNVKNLLYNFLKMYTDNL